MILTYRYAPIPWASPLGIFIDNTIGFAPHCNVAKARRKLSLINKISGKK